MQKVYYNKPYQAFLTQYALTNRSYIGDRIVWDIRQPLSELKIEDRESLDVKMNVQNGDVVRVCEGVTSPIKEPTGWGILRAIEWRMQQLITNKDYLMTQLAPLLPGCWKALYEKFEAGTLRVADVQYQKFYFGGWLERQENGVWTFRRHDLKELKD